VNHGISLEVLDEMLEVQEKKSYVSDGSNTVWYNNNFDLYLAPTGNWLDTLYITMAPEIPMPDELTWHAGKFEYIYTHTCFVSFF
jgi:hypothetical protein